MSDFHKIITPDQESPAETEAISSIVAELESEWERHRQLLETHITMLKEAAGLEQSPAIQNLGSLIERTTDTSGSIRLRPSLGKMVQSRPRLEDKVPSDPILGARGPSQAAVRKLYPIIQGELTCSPEPLIMFEDEPSTEQVNTPSEIRLGLHIEFFKNDVLKTMEHDGAHIFDIIDARNFLDKLPIDPSRSLFVMTGGLKETIERGLVDALTKVSQKWKSGSRSELKEIKCEIASFLSPLKHILKPDSSEKIAGLIKELVNSSATAPEGEEEYKPSESAASDSEQKKEGQNHRPFKKQGKALSWVGGAVVASTMFTGSSPEMTWVLLSVAMVLCFIIGTCYYRDMKTALPGT